MGVNFAAQIQPPPQGQEGSQPSAPVRPSNSSRAQKPFSSVLRAVHHDETAGQNTSSKPGQTKADRARTTAESDAQENQTRSKERPESDASQTQTSQTSTQSSEGRAQQTQSDQTSTSHETAPSTQETATDPIVTEATAQSMVLALLQSQQPQQAVTPVDDASPVADGDAEQALEVPHTTIEMTVPSVTVTTDQAVSPQMTSFAPIESDLADTSTKDVPETITRTTMSDERAQTLPVTEQSTSDTAKPADTGMPLKDKAGTDAPPVPGDKEDQADRTSPVTTAASPEQAPEQTVTDPQPQFARDTNEFTLRPLRDEQPAAPRKDSLFHETSYKEGTRPTHEAAGPHGWREFSDSDQHSEMTSGSENQEPSHERADRPLVREASVSGSTVPDHQTPSASTVTLTPSAQVLPRAVDAYPVTPAAPAQPIAAPRDAMDASVPGHSRSVVFEVAQPDLGRINVRVAMTNDLVHTHISSDRSDIGQVLISGQDRLQAALQAAGLDMGQFRVDIDRQSAGRSFHQGQPHEQGQAWQHNTSSNSGEAGVPEPADNRWTRSHGMLNLVA